MELSEEHMKTLEMDCSASYLTVRKVLSSGSLLPAKLTCIGKVLASKARFTMEVSPINPVG